MIKDVVYENYEYVPKNKIFNFFSNVLYYIIAFPILYVITKIVYNLKIEGKENLKDIKSGAITISNHVLILDCAMVRISIRSKTCIFHNSRR